MSTLQYIDPYFLARKYRNATFHSQDEPAEIIYNASGIRLHQLRCRSLNIPKEWTIKIISGYGLRYTKTVRDSRGKRFCQDEWVEVIPGNIEDNRKSLEEELKEAYVVYHKPTKKIQKRFGSKVDLNHRKLKDVEEFDQNNPKHQKKLNDLVEATKDLTPFKQSQVAFRELRNFWITIDDFLLIRKWLGLPEFPDPSLFQEVLLKLKEELLCNCFGTYLSSSQCGASSKHNLNHHDSVRLAFHFDDERSDDERSDDEEPFVKICLNTDYRKKDGSIGSRKDPDVHIDFSSFLQGDFRWFQPICRAEYPFAEFDYKTVKHPIDEMERKEGKRNRLIDCKNTRGSGYG